MRTLFYLFSLLMVLVGLLFGALNPQPVSVDLYLWQLQPRLGTALLSTAVLTALAGGGCVWLGVVLPLRARLRRLQRQAQADAAATAARDTPQLTDGSRPA